MASEVIPSRLRDLAVGRTDLMKFDPKLIRIEKGHNPRDYRLPENRAHLDSLKIMIAKDGVRMPLSVRFDAGQAILVDGESRLTAVLELIKEGTPIKSVPVQQVIANNEADRIAISVQANTGKPLSEWELGGAFKRLAGFGWSNDDISSSFGMTAKHVGKCIELSDAPQDVKQLLSERAITPALALTTIRKKGSVKASEELKETASKRKAEGKKGPAKAERKVTMSAWEIVGRAICKDVMEDFESNEAVKGTPQHSDFLTLRLGLAKKLMKLNNGEK